MIDMLTTKYSDIGTGFPLSSLLGYQTKEQLQKMADKIDINLPHSHRKERQAEELATAIVEDPLNTLRLLSKKEIGIVRQLVAAGSEVGVRVRKMPKTSYKLQKLFLVVSYDDGVDWLLFMPDELRLSFGKALTDPDFETLHGITAKEERRLHMLAWLYGAVEKD